MTKIPEPQIDLTAKDQGNSQKYSISPGMIAGIIVAIFALYFGFSSFTGSDTAEQYKGFIGEIEKSTQELSTDNQEVAIPQAPERTR
ncbi:hypothetical protein COU74_01930 [Candidatus Peregrinibacteria bacterium CG10_big_fil_rev_8_21_14_0_10_36_19]|nr:MAG: hypothetical protein COU74_01930 [Candidatus Peregrinibacteria bacterium CG10_big_fil_rev_8_21_14_0_10_36_19]